MIYTVIGQLNGRKHFEHIEAPSWEDAVLIVLKRYINDSLTITAVIAGRHDDEMSTKKTKGEA